VKVRQVRHYSNDPKISADQTEQARLSGNGKQTKFGLAQGAA